MAILITGGAGYIGSIAVKKLIENNNEVIIIDNLSNGRKELVHEKAKFYNVDLTNKPETEKVFEENEIESVIHFAAYKAVGESMENAVKYSDNLTGIINLLNSMVKFNCKKIVFSSSAAVYGNPAQEVIDESCELKPTSFYGYTKSAMEDIISWYSEIHKIKYIALRYFNVAGDELNYVDPNAQNVFPIIAEVIEGIREEFNIFGDDYETPDGTCIRDYIDVRDLVDAHILALESNYVGPINLGSGNGVSVKELVDTFKEVTKIDFKVKIGPRRAGDPKKSIASNKLAKEKLNWEPKKSLKDMIESTYKAYQNNK